MKDPMERYPYTKDTSYSYEYSEGRQEEFNFSFILINILGFTVGLFVLLLLFIYLVVGLA